MPGPVSAPGPAPFRDVVSAPGLPGAFFSPSPRPRNSRRRHGPCRRRCCPPSEPARQGALAALAARIVRACRLAAPPSPKRSPNSGASPRSAAPRGSPSGGSATRTRSPRAGAAPGEAAAAPYDGTAALAASQLAASLLGEIAPPGARWCGLEPAACLGPQERAALAPALDQAERLLQEHFAASNLAVELHQSLLDLVVAGTGALLAEAAPPGRALGAALPIRSLGRARSCFRARRGTSAPSSVAACSRCKLAARRWPAAAFLMQGEEQDGGTVAAVEAVRPEGSGSSLWLYDVFLDGEGQRCAAPSRLRPPLGEPRSWSSAGRGPTATSGGARRS